MWTFIGFFLYQAVVNSVKCFKNVRVYHICLYSMINTEKYDIKQICCSWPFLNKTVLLRKIPTVNMQINHKEVFQNFY